MPLVSNKNKIHKDALKGFIGHPAILLDIQQNSTKQEHWMWWGFPQTVEKNVTVSQQTRDYSLSQDEAVEYLKDDYLINALTKRFDAIAKKDITKFFNEIDLEKFCRSITLFKSALAKYKPEKDKESMTTLLSQAIDNAERQLHKNIKNNPSVLRSDLVSETSKKLSDRFEIVDQRKQEIQSLQTSPSDQTKVELPNTSEAKELRQLIEERIKNQDKGMLNAPSSVEGYIKSRYSEMVGCSNIAPFLLERIKIDNKFNALNKGSHQAEREWEAENDIVTLKEYNDYKNLDSKSLNDQEKLRFAKLTTEVKQIAGDFLDPKSDRATQKKQYLESLLPEPLKKQVFEIKLDSLIEKDFEHQKKNGVSNMPPRLDEYKAYVKNKAYAWAENLPNGTEWMIRYMQLANKYNHIDTSKQDRSVAQENLVKYDDEYSKVVREEYNFYKAKMSSGKLTPAENKRFETIERSPAVMQMVALEQPQHKPLKAKPQSSNASISNNSSTNKPAIKDLGEEFLSLYEKSPIKMTEEELDNFQMLLFDNTQALGKMKEFRTQSEQMTKDIASLNQTLGRAETAKIIKHLNAQTKDMNFEDKCQILQAQAALERVEPSSVDFSNMNISKPDSRLKDSNSSKEENESVKGKLKTVQGKETLGRR
jgi:uncharacterized protein (DUF1810 family)